jgi:hypothetical protein
MALVITKKVRTILLIVLTVLVVGGGGFLIWRVTQEESIAPEDSEAAPPDGVDGGTLVDLPCSGIVIDLGDANQQGPWGQYVCGNGCMSTPEKTLLCPSTRNFSISGEFSEGIYDITGIVGRGHENQQQDKEDFRLVINDLPNDSPLDVLSSGTSSSYAEEVEEIGTYHLLESSNPASMNHLHACPPEDSPMSVHLYKLCLEQVNVCNKGTAILPDPKNEYGTLSDPVLSIQTDDVDGIGDVTTAKLNGSDIPSCQSQDGAACYNISGTNIHISVAPGLQEIPEGEYNIEIAWTDGKGIGGSNCTMQASFEVAAAEIEADPACGTLVGTYSHDTTDWPDGTFCLIGDSEPTNPEFPSMGGSTTWTCSNGEGTEVSCTATRGDVDDPACGSLVGNYSSDTTDWPSGTFCSVGDPEPPNPEFPSQGGSTAWTCSNGEGTDVSCSATRDDITEAPTVPQTGIFDTVLGRVSVGVSFIFLGGLVSQYSKFNYILNSISERHQFRSEIKKQRKAKRRREKLEENFD